MSNHDIWNRIRPALFGDESWRDDLDGLSPGEYVQQLRRELAEAQRPTIERSEPTSIVAGDLRRLAEKIDALSSRLPPLLAPIPDAAEILGVSVSTVRRGIRDGSIPYRRIGRSVRVDLSACKGLDANDIARLARKARSGR